MINFYFIILLFHFFKISHGFIKIFSIDLFIQNLNQLLINIVSGACWSSCRERSSRARLHGLRDGGGWAWEEMLCTRISCTWVFGKLSSEKLWTGNLLVGISNSSGWNFSREGPLCIRKATGNYNAKTSLAVSLAPAAAISCLNVKKFHCVNYSLQ